MLDPLLLEVLACPRDKEPLLWFEAEEILYNPRLRLAYPVRGGIPIMLLDEAAELDGARHDELIAKELKAGTVAATNGASVEDVLDRANRLRGPAGSGAHG